MIYVPLIFTSPEIQALACLSPQLSFIYIDYVLKNMCCNTGSVLSWDPKTSVTAELRAAAPPSKIMLRQQPPVSRASATPSSGSGNARLRLWITYLCLKYQPPTS